MSEKARERPVEVHAGGRTLAGILGVPAHPVGAVLFAHGSGSGRFSPRNNAVALVLQRAGLATLLIDLLTEQEGEDRRLVFNIAFLSERLQHATDWLRSDRDTEGLELGYFGASTGAGAALVTAAQPGSIVRAVVSRGGRPDLALESLALVKAPTLLVVGGRDSAVLGVNEGALAALRCPKELVVVPGATHLFEEAGASEQVAALARDWFAKYVPLD